MTSKNVIQTVLLDPSYDGPLGNEPYFRTKAISVGTDIPKGEPRSRLLPEHPYEATYEYEINHPCYFQWVGDPVLHHYSCKSIGVSIGFDFIYPEENALINILYQKWIQSDFQLGVSIAEGRESARLMINRMITIANFAKAVKRRDFRSIFKIFSGKRRVSRVLRGRDLFLEFEYGWKPLIHDIYSASDYLKKQYKTTTLRARLERRCDIVVSRRSDVELAPGSRCKSRLQGKLYGAGLPSDMERLGLTDPLSIAWQILPLSFVADWFLPIGSNISALHNRYALSNSDIKYVITKCQSGWCRVLPFDMSNPDYTQVYSSEGTERKYFYMKRTVSNGVPAGLADAIPKTFDIKLDNLLRKLSWTSLLVSTRIKSIDHK
jgi:hypothetical protein